ncbi:hypothetical protein THAOC_08289 [Thalassiosira oceanica]|uniref:Uncharacterized protein n=1 Tax=Thalassiosira oceanica TaxID=159749 RepID=K0TIJ0_THAOC|nr:hypothetical protein THAOC_08289 [Thalassiosira oceanica]|eukprot:EJK70357.1 hypothetical protein THAOC_08289 [Thalassiosira oceanica]
MPLFDSVLCSKVNQKTKSIATQPGRPDLSPYATHVRQSETRLSESVEKSLSNSCLDSAERTSECSGGERGDGEEALADGRFYAAVEPAALMARRGPLSSSHPLVCPAEKSSAHTAVSAAPASQNTVAGGIGARVKARAESEDTLLDTATGGVGVGDHSLSD